MDWWRSGAGFRWVHGGPGPGRGGRGEVRWAAHGESGITYADWPALRDSNTCNRWVADPILLITLFTKNLHSSLEFRGIRNEFSHTMTVVLAWTVAKLKNVLAGQIGKLEEELKFYFKDEEIKRCGFKHKRLFLLIKHSCENIPPPTQANTQKCVFWTSLIKSATVAVHLKHMRKYLEFLIRLMIKEEFMLRQYRLKQGSSVQVKFANRELTTKNVLGTYFDPRRFPRIMQFTIPIFTLRIYQIWC